MTRKEIQDFSRRVVAFIDNRRLRDAISEIKDMARRRMAWEVEDKVKLTEQNYSLMLNYLTQGAIDPDRNDVYESLVADIYTLLDSLVSYIEAIDNPSLYYSTLRYNRHTTNANRLSTLINDYDAIADRLSLVTLATDPRDASALHAERSQLESIQREMFKLVWASPQLRADDAETIARIIADSRYSTPLKTQTVSAVTLGLLQQFDKRRLQLLMSAYLDSTDVRVASAALVGMLLGLWRYANRPLPRELANRLSAVKDRPEWAADLRLAFTELIRARDTERINRKMRDEVLPRMQKLRPDMLDKINEGKIPDDPASLQENPEWQDLLDKSGVTEQLKELTEIQMEGGDVMMSTFSHLKQFPFFNDIANWFLPYDPAHTSVAPTVANLDVLGDMMESAAFLCDSDKYSFIFALATVPEAQRQTMLAQMNAQRDSIYDAMGSMADTDRPELMRRAVNAYIQNIYRFNKLFPRRAEFTDPFDTGVNLIAVPALADDFNDTALLGVVAEFYFKLRYLSDALNVFNRLEQLQPGDAPRYQKMGYCLERMGRHAEAIDYYTRAELLDGNSEWVLRRLAAAYRATGDNTSALAYYRRLAEIRPDDLRTTMQLGYALLLCHKYDEAIQQFYKAEFLDEKSTKAWRPLAWALLLTQRYDDARRYYDRIMLDNPDADDYLNMGHLALTTGAMREAVNNYTLAVQCHHGDTEWLMQALAADTEALATAGADLGIVPLVADAVLYRLDTE